MLIVLSSLDSCDEFQTRRQAAANPQTTTTVWAVSRPVGCHHLHLPSWFIIKPRVGPLWTQTRITDADL